MRILVTADLHYDIKRSREGTQKLAAEVCAAAADALVLVGDTAGADPGPMGDCLNLFAGFAGKKFLVPGNHCLWCHGQEDSLERYHVLLPELAARCGFSLLDHSPAVMTGPSCDQAGRDVTVGLVGSIGWYDYGLAIESLGVPVDFYRAKVAPGAADYFQEHRHLVEAHRPVLTQRHMEMSTRWMDGIRVRLGMSDEQFVEHLSGKLRTQLDELSPIVEQVVAFVHHLPFGELVPQDRPDKFAFAAAYMGSQSLGDVLLANPKVSHVYCGHSHWGDDRRIGHLRVINVGSTYIDKRLAVLNI